jgi:hypothetical protein
LREQAWLGRVFGKRQRKPTKARQALKRGNTCIGTKSSFESGAVPSRFSSSRAPSSECDFQCDFQDVDQQEPTVSLQAAAAEAVNDYRANKDLLAIQGLAVQ